VSNLTKTDNGIPVTQTLSRPLKDRRLLSTPRGVTRQMPFFRGHPSSMLRQIDSFHEIDADLVVSLCPVGSQPKATWTYVESATSASSSWRTSATFIRAAGRLGGGASSSWAPCSQSPSRSPQGAVQTAPTVALMKPWHVCGPGPRRISDQMHLRANCSLWERSRDPTHPTDRHPGRR
jgi:hypothetical protein